jgi:serine phosphatase RsbU (regulator of sigma subunit)
MNAEHQEFTAARLVEVVSRSRDLAPKGIVDAIFDAVTVWRGDAAPNDDMTAVAVKLTA